MANDFNFEPTGYEPRPPFDFNFGVSEGTANLRGIIKGWKREEEKDLPAYLGGVLNSSTADLPALLQAYDTADLQALLQGYSTADLQGIIDVIEVRDLGASVFGYPPKDLPASLTGILFKGTKDLTASAVGYPPADLSALLHGWDKKDLGALLNIVRTKDLGAIMKVFSQEEKDLGATLIPGGFKNLPGVMHGWDYKDLGASSAAVFGPGDIQAYINPVPPEDLGGQITGWKGFQIPFDLPAAASGWGAADLNAVIGLIAAVDLGAEIFASGKIADLIGILIPKTIRMKKAIQISLLEHRDLNAFINFQCFASNFKDLRADLIPSYKLDLGAGIWAFHEGPDVNLAAYINAAEYTTQDKIIINFFGGENNPYTWLGITFGVKDKFIVTDDLPLIFTPAKNLGATIDGILRSRDLGASLTAVIQANYTELPYNVNPKSHEIVIEFDDRWREQFRTFVELTFSKDGTDNFHYFYVSGANEVYKVDKSRHWTIWADSYQNTEDEMVERRNTRTKYIFNMSKYANVDEAVRDLIDRVSAYRRANLSASINAVQVPQTNLGASIEAKVIYSWVKYLDATITGIPLP